MDVWHKETTPGTTGSRCTIRDGSGLFVAECIASDASRIVEAPAMVEALRTVSGKIGSYHDAETASSRAHIISDIEASVSAILSRIDGAGDTLPDAPVPAPTGEAKPAWFLNSYTCERCGYDWRDEWDCAVDDDCPACGARHISPTESEEIHG